MRLGISLFILGAILAFAVRAESSWLDVQTVGLVLIAGGLAFAAYARHRATRQTVREVTSRDSDERHGQVERTVVTEQEGDYR